MERQNSRSNYALRAYEEKIGRNLDWRERTYFIAGFRECEKQYKQNPGRILLSDKDGKCSTRYSFPRDYFPTGDECC